MSERTTPNWIPIAVALIGLIGSVAAAWVTTQSKFNDELNSKASEIGRLKEQVDAAEKRLSQQQADMEKRIAQVDERLKKLDDQIELAQKAVSTLTKLGAGLFSGKSKTKE